MENNLSIVMYHYVRPPNEKFSTKHNVLDTTEFSRQLNFLVSKCLLVDGRNIKGLQFGSDLSLKHAVWLTFDDGYLDHYKHVFPQLLEKKIVGSFFIPTKAIFERKLLDVNKVHILLAGRLSNQELIFQLEELFDTVSAVNFFKRPFSELREQYGVSTLLNDADTRFIKFYLQELLPADLRKIVLDNLFSQNVKRSESAFVDELYLTPDHVKIMFESGMNIGSHGHEHNRYEYMGFDSQKIDVEKSITYLRSIGVHDAQAVFCYPYGSLNDDIKKVIEGFGCELAVTINPGVAELGSNDLDWLELKRIDTKFFDNYFLV